MPIYEYQCVNPECGTTYEEIQAAEAPKIGSCSSCGGLARRIFSPISVGNIRSNGTKAYVILIDEVDELSRTRNTGNSPEDDKLVNVLNNNLDGVKKVEGIIVIGMTNSYQVMDPSILRRFDMKKEIPLPEYELRKQVFEVVLKRKTRGNSNNRRLAHSARFH